MSDFIEQINVVSANLVKKIEAQHKVIMVSPHDCAHIVRLLQEVRDELAKAREVIQRGRT